MAQALEVDLREIVLSNNSFGPNEIAFINKTISEDYSQLSVMRDAVAELGNLEDRSPATAVRLGVCYYLLGQFQKAIETLSNADGGALTHFYLGKSQFALEQYDAACASYEAAKTAGYREDDCNLAVVEAKRYAGEARQAMEILDQMFGPVEQTSEYLYQRGATVSALGENPGEVIRLYQRAVDSESPHPGALFGLAMENDRRGNDAVAIQLYQQAAACFPAHVGSLLNLGVLYEDQEDYENAQQCYQRIIEIYPGHERARLYLKDAGASGDMFYDEDAQKREDRLSQILSIPVTDFELSVRSRNCLQKMGINSLGDLTSTSEAELLASKNFGETSLIEIREILHAKGLELGQFAHEKAAPEPAYDVSSLSPQEQALLDRPIADLNLSVRARKCMVRLGLTTIGELVAKSGDDLLECKNFGVTSLNEVREKLTQLNLKLRGD